MKVRIGDLDRGTKFKFRQRQNSVILGTYMIIRQVSNTNTEYAACNYVDNMLYSVSSDIEVDVVNIWEELEQKLVAANNDNNTNNF